MVAPRLTPGCAARRAPLVPLSPTTTWPMPGPCPSYWHQHQAPSPAQSSLPHLEVFPADEADIHVDVGQGYGATLFEIKVEVLHGGEGREGNLNTG